MTRKRARKILMSIGTSRNHANWGLTAKPRWKTNAGVVEDTLTITLYAKLLRKKMDEGGITKESALHAGEMKASELWLREVNHARRIHQPKICWGTLSAWTLYESCMRCPPPTLRRWCGARTAGTVSMQRGARDMRAAEQLESIITQILDAQTENCEQTELQNERLAVCAR